MDTVTPPQGDTEQAKPAPANPELIELAARMARGELPGDEPARDPGADGPGAGAGAPPAAEADELKRALYKSAYGAARGMVDGLCLIIARRWPAAIYTEDEKHTLAWLIVPVALKRMNDPWFLKYREEFELGGFMLYMGYTGAQRVGAATPATPASSPLQREPNLPG